MQLHNSVLYFDDMRLLNEGPLPTERSTWGAVKALYE
jgi:hypothetical protein